MSEITPAGNQGLPWQGGQVDTQPGGHPACFYCLTGLCTPWHSGAARRSERHQYGVPAATYWRGTAACWDCAQQGSSSLP